jgi:hypothetical protein|tara:strand:+ start:56 stop:337 length:282 start_codon:yes stop_codon:yes gene_type:complete
MKSPIPAGGNKKNAGKSNNFYSNSNRNSNNILFMTIEVIQKEVYGNTLTYVADESVRNSIKKLTGRKTLTDYDIEALKELGFVLVLKQMTVNI